MPALFLPSIKDKLELQVDLEVGIRWESRNEKFIEVINPEKYLEIKKLNYQERRDVKHSTYIIIPAGTILTVDRIYIRNNAKDFDSVTFRHDKKDKKKTGSEFPHGRFWLNLSEINDKFVFEHVIE